MLYGGEVITSCAESAGIARSRSIVSPTWIDTSAAASQPAATRIAPLLSMPIGRGHRLPSGAIDSRSAAGGRRVATGRGRTSDLARAGEAVRAGGVAGARGLDAQAGRQAVRHRLDAVALEREAP